jgi:hypothetical protein
MNAARILLGLFATLFALGGNVGCGEEPPPPPPPTVDYPVTVSVKTETDVGVPKVPVLFGDKTVGYTDANGEFKASLRKQAGAELAISVGEAPGYRFLSETSVTEVLEANDVGGSLTGVPLLLNVSAQSLRNDYFFWVHANCDSNLPEGSCDGLEIKMNEEVIATTNDLGYAQFTVSEVPETEVVFEIDTPNYDPEDDDAIAMEPRDPEYTVKLDLEPQIYMIEEGFVDALAKKSRRSSSRRRSSSSRRKRSSRSRSSRKSKKKTKKVEEDDNGVIDLF